MKQMAKGKVKEREKRKENKIPCLTAAANVLKHDRSPSLFLREKRKRKKSETDKDSDE